MEVTINVEETLRGARGPVQITVRGEQFNWNVRLVRICEPNMHKFTPEISQINFNSPSNYDHTISKYIHSFKIVKNKKILLMIIFYVFKEHVTI